MLFGRPRAAPRRSTGATRQIPAPVGGLNARDSIADMPVSDAIVLDNIFPERNWVELRRGYAAHATGMPGPVETLMAYDGPSPSLWAVSGNEIYDVTSSGPVGSAAVTGLSNDRFQHINFTNAAGTWLVAVNGADGVRTYNGTSWSTQTITGVSAASLFCVASWKRRLWFGEQNTSRAWYLGTDAVSGAASALDLGAVWRLGGTLAGILTAAFDSGAGLQDYIGFMSSLGEVALYQGTDPTSAGLFALVGVYRLGAPIGKRFYAQSGGDLAVLTVDGLVSLTRSMQLDRSVAEREAVTDKISRLFASAWQAHGTNFGWEVIVWPEGHRAVVNVPTSTGAAEQYVMNTLSGAWCRMTQQPAATWAVFNGGLYFGAQDGGAVFQAEVSETDDGAPIPYELQSAYTDFGAAGRYKRFTLVRPLLEANAQPNASINLNVDYGNKLSGNVPIVGSGSGGVWGSLIWPWTWGGLRVVRPWVTVGGLGYVGSVQMKGQAQSLQMRVVAFDVVFEPAQTLGI